MGISSPIQGASEPLKRKTGSPIVPVRSGASRIASIVPSIVCSHSCAYTIHGCPDGSTYSVPSRVMSRLGGVGCVGSTTVKGPSRDSDTAVIVPRRWFGSWNGVPQRPVGGTGSGLSSSCSVVNR